MTEYLTEFQQLTLGLVQQRDKDHAITGAIIANTIGLKPRKDGKAGADMRSIIHALRVKGYPICATGAGYWWPRSEAELSAYIASFEGRVRDQESALKGLKTSHDKIDQTLEEMAPVEPKTLFYRGKRDDGSDIVFEVPENKLEVFLKAHPEATEI